MTAVYVLAGYFGLLLLIAPFVLGLCASCSISEDEDER